MDLCGGHTTLLLDAGKINQLSVVIHQDHKQQQQQQREAQKKAGVTLSALKRTPRGHETSEIEANVEADRPIWGRLPRPCKLCRA